MLDINAGVKSNIICFADDTRLLRAIKSDQDRAILQDDLVCVYDWAITNNMKFNDSKFQYINFNCSKESIPRKYLDPSKNIINVTKQIQDLGITLSVNCEFKAHINNVVKKMLQTVWLDFKNFYVQRSEDYVNTLETSCITKA